MATILKIVNCKEEFKYEGPRYISLGPESGEEFRETYFLPWLQANKGKTDLTVDFAGTIVYTPSFLEETFGGAIRKGYLEVEHLSFINIPEKQKEKIQEYIIDAISKTKGEKK